MRQINHELSSNGKDHVTDEAVRLAVKENRAGLKRVVPVPIERKRLLVNAYEVYRFIYNWVAMLFHLKLESYQILNGDEMNIGGRGLINRRPAKVYVPEDHEAKPFYKLHTSAPSTTLMMFTCPFGDLFNPWFLLTQKSSSRRLTHELVRQRVTPIYDAKSRYMTMETFAKYFKDLIGWWRGQILPSLGYTKASGPSSPATMPLAVMIDGAPGHKAGAGVYTAWRKGNVYVLLLPANATNIFQVVDLCIAKKVRKGGTAPSTTYRDTDGEDKHTEGLTMTNILRQVGDNLTEIRRLSFQEHAWECSGLWPFNPLKIDNREQLEPSIRQKLHSLAGLTPVQQMGQLTQWMRIEEIGGNGASGMGGCVMGARQNDPFMGPPGTAAWPEEEVEEGEPIPDDVEDGPINE